MEAVAGAQASRCIRRRPVERRREQAEQMQMQLGSMMLAVERGAGAAWRRGARGVILVQLFLWETKQWESSGDDARLRRLAVMLQGGRGRAGGVGRESSRGTRGLGARFYKARREEQRPSLMGEETTGNTDGQRTLMAMVIARPLLHECSRRLLLF